MIRIEVRDHKGHVLEVINSDRTHIKIGRGTNNQIILPDFTVDPTALEINLTPEGIYEMIIQGEKFEIKKNHELDLGKFHLRIIDLREFDKPTPAHIISEKPGWYTTVGLFSLLTIILLFSDVLERTSELKFTEMLKGLLSIIVVFGLLNIILSVASRVLNGEYKFWKLANITLIHSILTIFILNNLLGLRWIFPFFKYSEIYAFNYFLLSASLIWFLGHHIFSQLKNKIRLSVFFIVFSIAIIFQVIRLIPTGDTKNYLTLQSPPPRLNLLESKIITVDQFTEQLIESETD